MTKRLTKKARPRVTVELRPQADIRALVRKLNMVQTNVETMAVARPAALGLTDQPTIGQLGLVELKLTDDEERICSEPVDPTRVLIKPSGQPYLPHGELTRWMNRAFGRTGWALVPTSVPVEARSVNKTQVICHYMLHIHGKPVAAAFGEQEYWDNNFEQSKGDALEATVASALRRCLKRLGIGLELWDRLWLDAFVADRCVLVKAWKTGRDGTRRIADVWRLKAQAQLPGEIGAAAALEAQEDAQPAQRAARPVYDAPAKRAAAPVVPNAKAGAPVTEEQLKRFWTIATNAGRSHDVVKAWLEELGYKSSREITRAVYDGLVEALESSKPLPTSAVKGGN